MSDEIVLSFVLPLVFTLIGVGLLTSATLYYKRTVEVAPLLACHRVTPPSVVVKTISICACIACSPCYLHRLH